jgi:MYXO-CTERM domain-containing protein
LTTKGSGSGSNSGTCAGALSIGAGATITISGSNGITDSPPNQAVPLCNAIVASDPNAFTGGNITISPDPATSTPSVQVQPDPPASTPSEPTPTNSSASADGGAFSPWAIGTLLLGVLARMRKGERQSIPVQPISGR